MANRLIRVLLWMAIRLKKCGNILTVINVGKEVYVADVENYKDRFPSTEQLVKKYERSN